ncbi:hypothetical protein JFT60_28080 [Pseudomonas sp. MF6772]|uniref:hypothetical protein n=1 Tax=Pseudomonas sp. MF6772 TaxID=2797533 RepID=UPI0018E8F142|nr:hypothetical protein [Pseudomonas sp. MF6772]MBJ2271240.1 hypothetical protein [Pseudomonas sp. MF6772]
MIMNFARASILALSIGAAISGGFAAANSGVETYKKAVEMSQAHWASAPQMMPSDKKPSDQILLRANYIYAWVLGPDCLINKIRTPPIDPWKSLQVKIEEWARIPGVYSDNAVITIVIKVPDAPGDVTALVEALKSHSFLYAPDAGTGFLEAPYLFKGMSNT